MKQEKFFCLDQDSNPGLQLYILSLNPDPGENFSLKLTTQDLPDGYSENLSFHNKATLF